MTPTTHAYSAAQIPFPLLKIAGSAFGHRRNETHTNHPQAKVHTIRTLRTPSPADRETAAQKMLAERNELVLEHLPLVKAIAARWRAKLPVHLEFSDLVHAGIVGLLDAAGKYDASTAASFSTYATHRIRGAILDSLRGQDPASRKLRRQHREIESVRHDLAQQLQRCPTDTEVAEKYGIDLESLRAVDLAIHEMSEVSLTDDDPAVAKFEPAAGANTQPERIFELNERDSLVREAIENLPESYRIVITMHYTSDLSLKEIGGSIGVPERQVSRIHNRALRRIDTMLRAKGIQSTEAR